MDSYFDGVIERLNRVKSTQAQAIKTAGAEVARAVKSGALWFVFGTGHSHMLAEEAFYRAGGLVSVAPILESVLMLHESALQSSEMERVSGLAPVILDRRGITAADVLLIASNSGRNSVPVEMAKAARKRGVFTIAITSLEHSNQVSSRAPSGERLFEVVDLVIDNGAPLGDAIVKLGDEGVTMGAVSTVTGAAIINAIAIEAARLLGNEGHEVRAWRSANLHDGGVDDGAAGDVGDPLAALGPLQSRIRHL